MNPKIKGLIMTLLSCIVALISNGIPATSIAWEVSGISILGTLIGYVAQSFLVSSTSDANQINGRDFLKGALVVLGNGLSTWAASAITSTVLDWKSMLMGMGVLMLGYLAKQFKTDPTGIPPTK